MFSANVTSKVYCLRRSQRWKSAAMDIAAVSVVRMDVRTRELAEDVSGRG
jgi:hypothetical protein